MDGFQVICTILVAVVAGVDFCGGADREYMVSKAESVAVSINFEKKLECVMNIEPDSFQWKFYPLDKKDACNPKARISLTTSPFQFVPPTKNEKKMSSLTLQARSKDIAGDYQCLAFYGASVVASIPWRVTLTKSVTRFPPQERKTATVLVGNTVNWRCDVPEANPEPYVDYKRNGEYFKPLIPFETKSLIITNVSTEHSGSYTCAAGNVDGQLDSEAVFNLNVVKHKDHEPPKFLIPPKKEYFVTKSDTVFLECAAVGNPVPEVVWAKKNGALPENRIEMVYGGLKITNVSSSDHGTYECTQKNKFGKVTHQIFVHYQEPPEIDCPTEEASIDQGQNLELDCAVTGTPKPEITWFLNGFAVNDSKIFTDSNNISFKPAEKRHAGKLQIFARNVLGTVYRSISITVIPTSKTQESAGEILTQPPRGNHRRTSKKPPRHGKMVPPSRPNITRINDEAVLLRWTVQSKGLPIQFFKVQYKELGSANAHDSHSRGKGSKWITPSAEISNHIRSHEVTNLKPDHYYRFRIVAVYSNNDNKNSENSEKFLLRKLDFDDRTPLPVPAITRVEPVNATSVRIYWKPNSSPSNITVDGYVVNYVSASKATDYMKATVDGANTDSYILSHLLPDTVYDIKLQSFTKDKASHSSEIHIVKTPGESSTTNKPLATSSAPKLETAGISKLYIIIAVGVIGGCGVIVAAIVLFLFCRKSKDNRGDCDKAEEHHIQADGGEYVVGPKNPARTNGCIPSNRITITANPLADADSKNQNMMEMSCLSSQNNNCSAVQPSVSAEDSPTNSRDKKSKNRERRIRDKRGDSNTSGENYV